MPAVANVLARAFFDDPLFTYVSPDATLRHGQLRAFMAFCCRYGDRFGEIYTTAGTVDGAALWAPPSAVPDFTPEQLEAAGIAHAVQALGEEAMGRFGAVLDHLEALRQRDMPAPHWYLFGLGVDPDRQGRGIGGQLLQPMLRRADAAGLPCHLETQKVRNLPFYQRHGFAVLTETDVPWGGPHLWIMQRPPLAIAPAWQAATLQAQVDDRTFAAGWARGQAMTLEEALTFAAEVTPSAQAE